MYLAADLELHDIVLNITYSWGKTQTVKHQHVNQQFSILLSGIKLQNKNKMAHKWNYQLEHLVDISILIVAI